MIVPIKIHPAVPTSPTQLRCFQNFFPTCISTWSGPRPERLEVVLSRPEIIVQKNEVSWSWVYSSPKLRMYVHCYIYIYVYTYASNAVPPPPVFKIGSEFTRPSLHELNTYTWLSTHWCIIYIYTVVWLYVYMGLFVWGLWIRDFPFFKAPNKEVLTFNHVCQRCGCCHSFCQQVTETKTPSLCFPFISLTVLYVQNKFVRTY